MNIEVIRQALGWCSVINIGLFFLSFIILTLGRDWVYRVHGKWYKLTPEQFDATWYAIMAFYKIIILFFNIVPYIALRIAG